MLEPIQAFLAISTLFVVIIEDIIILKSSARSMFFIAFERNSDFPGPSTMILTSTGRLTSTD